MQQVYGKQIKRRSARDVVVSQPAQNLKRYEHKPSLAERIAESSIFFRSWYYPGGIEAFPYRADLMVVDMYFPNAKGGPLCIDIPQDEESLRACEIKAHVVKKKNRYLVIKPEMTFNEALEALSL
jgi:hypothetical protein